MGNPFNADMLQRQFLSDQIRPNSFMLSVQVVQPLYPFVRRFMFGMASLQIRILFRLVRDLHGNAIMNQLRRPLFHSWRHQGGDGT